MQATAPPLSLAEILIIETDGEHLGLAPDKQMFEYFRRRHKTLFPALSKVHQTTFSRQAANRWRVNEQIWQEVLRQVKFDSEVALD